MSGSAFMPGTGFPGSIIPGFDPPSPPPPYIPPGTVQPGTVTISTPLIAPPQQFTNVPTLINGQANAIKTLLFISNRSATSGSAVLPGASLPGTSFPGFPVQVTPYSRLLTEGQDYSINGGIVTMVVPPLAGDILYAVVFAIGVALGGPLPTRYIAPWHLPLALTGDYDGAGTLYRVVFGPTIFGTLDGVNRVFTFGVTLQRSSVWVNGLLQSLGTDVVTGPTSMVFLAGHVPVAGDLITMTGWL